MGMCVGVIEVVGNRSILKLVCKLVQNFIIRAYKGYVYAQYTFDVCVHAGALHRLTACMLEWPIFLVHCVLRCVLQ